MTSDRGVARVRPAALAALALLAAGWFAVGIRWTLGWPLGWIDSGLVVYGSWRVADGAVPYRDFDHVYGPALFYLNAALLRVFGADLAVVVASLLVLKVVLVLLVFALARRVAGAGVATATALFLVVVWGAPLWLFSAPYAQHYGTVSALAGLLAVARGTGGRRRALLAGGLWAGIAATFKLTSGLFALLAFLLWALAEPAGSRHGAGRRVVRAGAAAGVLVTGLLYALGSLRADAGAAVPTVLVVALPFAWTAAAVLRDGLRRPDADGTGDLLAVAAAAALPLLVFGAFFLARGAAADFARDLLALPTSLRWFEPLPVPSAEAVLLVGAAALAAAPGRWRRAAWVAAAALVAAVVAARPDGVAWGAYLTGHLVGRVAFDLAAYLPVLAVVAGLLVGVSEPVPRLYHCFAATNLLLLLPAADVWHGLMTLPAALPLVAHLVARARPAAAPLALLAVVAVPFVVQLGTARAAWRTATAHFARATGLTHPEAKFDDVAAVVRWLGAPQARERGVLVLTAEAMIYFLAGRVSAFEHEEYLLHAMVRDAASPATVALLTDDRRFARRLRTERPLVVDDVAGTARAKLRRLLPRTARALDTRYRTVETFGRYVVLAPRP